MRLVLADILALGESPDYPITTSLSGNSAVVILSMAATVLQFQHTWIGVGEKLTDEEKDSIGALVSELLNEVMEGAEPEMPVPLGTILPFTGSSIPEKYHEMNGDYLLADDYPDLWAVIDDEFKGTVGEENAIQLISMVFRTPIGYSSVGEYWPMGSTGGEVEHTLSVLEIPEHNHEFISGYPAYNNARTARGADYGAQENLVTEYAGGGEPHNNMPPYICVRWIMRVLP